MRSNDSAVATRSPAATDRTPIPEDCLQLYRHLSAGVAVLSAQSDTGPTGLTASSVTSLSLIPPMLSANLAEHSYTLAAIRAQQVFGVQLLADTQHALARDFASPHGQRFGRYEHRHIGGVPILTDSLGWAVCTLVDARRYGDHVLIVGEVTTLGVTPGTAPLIWHNQGFARLGTEPQAAVHRDLQPTTGNQSCPTGRPAPEPELAR